MLGSLIAAAVAAAAVAAAGAYHVRAFRREALASRERLAQIIRNGELEQERAEARWRELIAAADRYELPDGRVVTFEEVRAILQLDAEPSTDPRPSVASA